MTVHHFVRHCLRCLPGKRGFTFNVCGAYLDVFTLNNLSLKVIRHFRWLYTHESGLFEVLPVQEGIWSQVPCLYGLISWQVYPFFCAHKKNNESINLFLPCWTVRFWRPSCLSLIPFPLINLNLQTLSCASTRGINEQRKRHLSPHGSCSRPLL